MYMVKRIDKSTGCVKVIQHSYKVGERLGRLPQESAAAYTLCTQFVLPTHGMAPESINVMQATLLNMLDYIRALVRNKRYRKAIVATEADTKKKIADSNTPQVERVDAIYAEAVEGVMLKRKDAAYLPGRPKGQWWKWKRAPHVVDAVMMYAQRGHGKRSSFYSDYTFGVWREAPEGGEELVPVGKAYHGFTDAELAKLDRYVRNHTTKRFGPVREVAYGREAGLVLEIAFEGVQRSTRHKSGVAMRFPRVSRIRWDKPPAEADRIDVLERILARGEKEIAPGAGLQEDA